MGQVIRWQYSQGGSSGTGEQVAVLTGGLKWDR